MIGAARFAGQLHPGFIRRPVTLAVVAPFTGTDHVLPGIAPAETLGDNMVDRHRTLLVTAILASVTVTLNDILAGEQYPLERIPSLA